MKPLPSLSPRGSLLSTGEDTAARGSAKGRSLLVSVTRGETPTTNSVAHATLTPLQADAAAGAYARTMAAYIQHVASRGLDHQLDRLKQLTTEFRDQAMREEVHGHARTPGILADLAAGYRLFLEWAGTVIADLDPTAASEEHWKWLCTLAPDQAEQQEEADDALRWRDLVHSALTVGRAYIVGPTGAVPTSHQAECGWNVTIWQEMNNQPRPEAVVLGRPPEGAVYVRLPPLGAWSWSGPGFSQAPAEASPLMTNSRLIQCHARVLPSPDQNGKSTPDRSKLFGSHGQRPWF